MQVSPALSPSPGTVSTIGSGQRGRGVLGLELSLLKQFQYLIEDSNCSFWGCCYRVTNHPKLEGVSPSYPAPSQDLNAGRAYEVRAPWCLASAEEFEPGGLIWKLLHTHVLAGGHFQTRAACGAALWGPESPTAWWPQGLRLLHRASGLRKQALQASPDPDSEALQHHPSCALLVEPVPSPSRVGTQGPMCNLKTCLRGTWCESGHDVLARILGRTPCPEAPQLDA